MKFMFLLQCFLMIFFFLLFFLLFAMSCSSFWSLWVCFEVFTLFLSSYLSLQKSASSWIFNYFIVQTVGSVLFLFGILSNFIIFKIFFCHMGLFMKLGAFPFHSWTFLFIEKLNWKNVAIVFSFPKFIPICGFYLLTAVSFYWTFFFSLSLSGSCIPISNLKMTTVRSIISYSAVVHTSWILASCMLGKQTSFFYFFFYIFLLLPLCVVFFSSSIKSLKDLIFSKSMTTSFFFANFTGLPPFLGFFLKYIVLIKMFENLLFFEGGVLGVFSILPIYLYVKMFFFSILKSKISKDFFLPQDFFFFLLFSLFFLLFSLFFFVF